MNVLLFDPSIAGKFIILRNQEIKVLMFLLSNMAHRGFVLTIYRYINPFLVQDLAKVNWALSFEHGFVEKLRSKLDFTMFLFCKVSCIKVTLIVELCP